MDYSPQDIYNFSHDGDIKKLRVALNKDNTSSNWFIDETNDEANAIIAASSNGHSLCVSELLDRGAAIESTTILGTTSLHVCAERGHIDVFRILANRGADIDCKDYNSWTPSMYAAENGHLDILREALNRGAFINHSNSYRLTSLHVAAQKGHISCLNELINRGADVNTKDLSGRTPLFIAAEAGRGYCCFVLLEKGADIDTKETDSGKSSLYIAYEKGYVDIVDELIRRGADSSELSRLGIDISNIYEPVDINDLFLFGSRFTNISFIGKASLIKGVMLYRAAENGDINTVRKVLSRGAAVDIRVDCQDSSNRAYDGSPSTVRKTPLYIATEKGYIDIVLLLVSRGATVDIVVNRKTPLCVAAEKGFIKLVRILLNKGASLHGSGKQSLVAAILYDHIDIVKELINRGVDIEGFNIRRKFSISSISSIHIPTPLHIAVRCSNIAVVRLILDRLDVNRSTGQSSSYFRSSFYKPCNYLERKEFGDKAAIHIAIENNNVAIVTELLNRGASPSTRTEDGSTPLHLALKYGSNDCFNELLNRDVDLNVKDAYGNSPLFLAVEKANLNALRGLLARGASLSITVTDDMTILHLAIKQSYQPNGVDCLHELLTRQIEPELLDAKTKEGLSALHLAIERISAILLPIDCALLLIRKGAAVGCKDNDGYTDTHKTAGGDHVDILREILDRGAAIDDPDNFGWTPLHYAAANGCLRCLIELLQRGADLERRDCNGRTALYASAEYGYDKCMIELLNRGADIECANKIDGKTPLYIAAINGNAECCRLLLQNEARVFENINDYVSLESICQKLISREITSRKHKNKQFCTSVTSYIEYKPYKNIIYSTCFPSGYSSVSIPAVGWKRAEELKQELYVKEITFNLHLSIAKTYAKQSPSAIDHIASNSNKTFILMKLLTMGLKEYLLPDIKDSSKQ